jgi:hypothetical protein
MPRVTLLPALGLLLAVLVAASAGCVPQAPEPIDIRWGEPAGGFQVGLAVKSVAAGERPRVALIVAVRNAGSEQVRFLKLAVRSGYWGPKLPLDVAVDGKSCVYHGASPGKASAPPMDAYLWLMPGAEDETEAVMSPELWDLRPPFAADLTFVFGQARSGTVRVRAGR